MHRSSTCFASAPISIVLLWFVKWHLSLPGPSFSGSLATMAYLALLENPELPPKLSFVRIKTAHLTYYVLHQFHRMQGRIPLTFILTMRSAIWLSPFQAYLDTVMSVDARVMSMHPSSKSESEQRSTQTCFVLGLIWIASTSGPRPPSSTRLEMMICSQCLSWRPFPVILIC